MPASHAMAAHMAVRGRVGGGPESAFLEKPKAKGHFLSAIVKINMRLWNDLTDDDVVELFHFMDETRDGHVSFVEFNKLLSGALKPPLAETDLADLYRDIHYDAKDGDGRLELSDLKSALYSGALKASLKRVHRQRTERLALDFQMKQDGPPVPRALFIDRLAWRVSRDDSFYTLPYTMLFIVVFILVVVSHLQIYTRFKVQRGMETWVKGYAASYDGPYLGDHISNKDQFFQWLEFSGLPLALGDCRPGLDGSPVCHTAPRTVLVGDLKLVVTLEDGSENYEWLLHSPQGEAHLALPGKQDDFLQAAQLRLKSLRNDGWGMTHDTSILTMTFSTYNEDEGVFAVTRSYARVTPAELGYILTDCECRAVVVNPYKDWFLYIVDGFYVGMILWSAFLEAQQMCVRGCLGYWDHCGPEGGWNAVDLFGLAMGFCNIAQWVLFIMLVSSSELRNVLVDSADGELKLTPRAMSLQLSVIEQLESQLDAGSAAYYGMSVAMGTNVLSIIMKLFKAFGANARLQLVSNTLAKAAPDLFHFGIVFGALFIGFALVGHILFGEDIEEFRSFSQSVNTAFESLLGDFDWYSDGVISPTRLGSGLPYWVVVVWFYAYMIFVVLVMMNMLLAIVMDHYMNLLGNVRGDPANAPPLWTQTIHMYQRYKEQKGFISGAKVLHQLVDLNEHPEAEVTAESMATAFTKMSTAQIDNLMTMLKQEAAKRVVVDEEDETLKQLSGLKSQVGDIADQVRIVTHTACKAMIKIDELDGRMTAKETPKSQELDQKAEKAQRPHGYEDLERLIGDVKTMVVQLSEQQKRASERQTQMDSAFTKVLQVPGRQLPPPAGGSMCTSMTSSSPEQIPLYQMPQ